MITKIASDGDQFTPNHNAYYHIHVCNPNDATVCLNNITDTLPSGFSYNEGSSSGLANFDPNIAGQTLTWIFDGEHVGGGLCEALQLHGLYLGRRAAGYVLQPGERGQRCGHVVDRADSADPGADRG